jgi:hypothetical protein
MTAVFTSSSWRPEAALGVEWLDRDQQLGEETFQDLQQNRPRVGQARKCIREEYLREDAPIKRVVEAVVGRSSVRIEHAHAHLGALPRQNGDPAAPRLRTDLILAMACLARSVISPQEPALIRSLGPSHEPPIAAMLGSAR